MLSCKSNVEKIQPIKRNLIESVYASVEVQPDSLYKVYAAVGGILDEIYVEEGDEVSKGELLLKLSSNTAEYSSENARLSLKMAEENYSGSSAILKSLENDMRAAELKYFNDSINYFRQKNLWEKNIGSKAEYDGKKLAYELSATNLANLRTNYTRSKKELETRYHQAINQYRSSLSTSGEFTVESKIDGKVYSLLKNQGEFVNSLEPIATLGSSNSFILELLVDEVDVVKIRKDQEVVVHLDAYNGKVFEARILRILPEKDKRNQTFLVEAKFDNPPEVLYPGLSGEANIIVGKTDSVLTIPKRFLIDDKKVRTENGLIDVELGLQNLEYVQVISGISENDWILQPEGETDE